MISLESASWRAAVIGHWTARIAGALMFLLFMALFFGEGPPDLSRLTFTERLHALGVAAMFLGLPIAWKWEGMGGLITVAGFGFLAAVSGGNLHRWLLYMPALTGAVHLASWGRLRMAAPPNMVPWRLPGSVAVSLLAVMAIFLLLCANEIFGQPPMMTPSLHPDNRLGGSWHSTGSIPVEFVIRSDGAITGTVGEAAITEGHVTYGRSWFGRLLHMNSPYRVTGKLSGERFTAPFEYASEALEGSLFFRHHPMHVMLTRQQP